MNTDQMIACVGLESCGFKAGQKSERKRIQDLIELRQEEIKVLLTNGAHPAVKRTARAAIAELGYFFNQLDEAGQADE